MTNTDGIRDPGLAAALNRLGRKVAAKHTNGAITPAPRPVRHPRDPNGFYTRHTEEEKDAARLRAKAITGEKDD